MNNWLDIRRFKADFQKIQAQTKQIAKEVWPINWSNFKKPKLVTASFLESSYAVKSIFFIAITGLLISSYFFFLGNYLALTKEVPATGGEVREAVIDQDFKLFNPVLDLRSESERKVSRLLYHPLYHVDFPDFLDYSIDDQPESTTETKTLAPSITPILLDQAPQWQDLQETDPNNKYKVLRFKLKDGLKWSNGLNIDLDDVEYSFNRLKEVGANNQFKEVFSKVEFVKIAENEFDLRSATPNPQLIYLANFSPISKDFFNLQSIDQLYTSFNSSKPLVTSGYFTFTTDQVNDPDKPNSPKRDNPIREDGNDNFQTVILTRNDYQNSENKPNINTYIIRRYNSILDAGGSDIESIERAVKNRNVDIFTRTLSLNSDISSQEMQSSLGLNQKSIGTNTYYNLYLNIKRNGVFLNQQLRKYLICNLISYSAQEAYFALEDIPITKRLVPIQFGVTTQPDCPTDTSEILDGKNFKLDINEKTGIKRILTCGRRCRQISKISLVSFEETDGLVTELQAILRDIGMPAEVYKTPQQVQTKLADKSYSLVFLPITLVSSDPYPIYGATSRDLSQIRLNNQKSILDAKVEDNIYNYSISNLTDQQSKESLIDFFSKEYISINLFRSKFEINYSDRVSGLSDNLPNFEHINKQIYLSIPQWYTQTKRQWK
ncbi:MAG: ABC transporter substrate-binding protein [Patescibacteria group bacterium]